MKRKISRCIGKKKTETADTHVERNKRKLTDVYVVIKVERKEIEKKKDQETEIVCYKEKRGKKKEASIGDECIVRIGQFFYYYAVTLTIAKIMFF